MQVTIYALIDPSTQAIRYVGLTRDVKARLRRYRDRPHTKHLCNWFSSLKDRGLFPALEVLEVTDDQGADACERKWIAHYRSIGADLINLTDGGEGACRMSDETRAKIAEKARGRRYGPMSEQHRKKISEANKGKSFGRPEVFVALNKARAGVPLSEEHKRKVSEGVRRSMTPEVRQKLSEKGRGRKLRPKTEAERVAMSERLRVYHAAHPEYREASASRKRGKPLTDEHRRKVSEGVRRSQTPEYRKKMSVIKKAAGRVTFLTEESKRKISESLKRYNAKRRGERSTIAESR
jgi:hypothetical protein